MTAANVVRGPGVDELHEGAFVHLDPKTLQINPHNVRILGSASIKDLSDLDSIAVHGVIEPLKITSERVIVCGHRRQARAIQAKLQTVPCVVNNLSDAEQVQVALAENLGRTSLTPVEEAVAYQMLIDIMGDDVKQIAAQVGVSAVQVQDRLDLLALPQVVQQAVDNNQITLALAKRLVVLKDHPKDIEKLAKRWASGQSPVPVNDAWEVENTIRTIQTRETKARLKAEAHAKSLSVVALPPMYGRAEGDPVRIGKGINEADLDLRKHKRLKCHAVGIQAEGEKGELVPVCVTPANHPELVKPARPAYQGNTEWAQEQARRDQLRDAFRAGRDVRLEIWRGLIPDGGIIMQTYAQGIACSAASQAGAICSLLDIPVADGGAWPTLLQWLAEDDGLHLRENQVLRASIALQFENRFADPYKGWGHPFAVKMVETLVAHGYQLSKTEAELWESTAQLRAKMAEDPQYRYTTPEEEEETDSDLYGSGDPDEDELEQDEEAVVADATEEGAA